LLLNIGHISQKSRLKFIQLIVGFIFLIDEFPGVLNIGFNALVFLLFVAENLEGKSISKKK
jgi:hypothetical protein